MANIIKRLDTIKNRSILKNNILLKLSNNSTMADLNYAYEFLENNTNEKFTTIDIRIDNQVILNE